MKKMITIIEDLGMQYPTSTSKKKIRYGLYKCECGNEFKTQIASVKRGLTQSCGCYKNQKAIETQTTHGLSSHSLYNLWKKMKDRTTNPKHKSFKNYGGRGITICNEWMNDFKAFYEWAMANGYKEELQIDRINNDSEYSPDNCRWVTQTVQNRNTRKIRITNKSGYRGVSWSKNTGNWRATIGINGKQKHLGRFTTALEAAIAYDTFVIVYGLEHTQNFA